MSNGVAVKRHFPDGKVYGFNRWLCVDCSSSAERDPAVGWMGLPSDRVFVLPRDYKIQERSGAGTLNRDPVMSERSEPITLKLSCEPEPTSTVASPPRAGGEARQLQRLLDIRAKPGSNPSDGPGASQRTTDRQRTAFLAWTRGTPIYHLHPLRSCLMRSRFPESSISVASRRSRVS